MYWALSYAQRFIRDLGIKSALARRSPRRTAWGVGVFGVSAHIENVSTLTLLAPPERSSATQTTGVLSAREHPPHSAHHFSRGAISALVVGVLVAVLTTRDPLWWQLHFS